MSSTDTVIKPTAADTTRMRHFGLFDHLDNNGRESPAEHYRQRLALIAACDDGTFHGYHLAEHHCTPLGQACSPSVFLAAVAARTERLRIIPTIYPLPLYHPIRLLEEVAMLDHLSQGRLEIGVGPGGSPPEQLMFGVDPEQAMPAFLEAYEVFKQGLSSGRIHYEGKHFRFDNSELFMRCQQMPHPRLWYGASSDRSVQWLAGEGMNMLTGGSFERLRSVSAMYRQHYRRVLSDGLEPKVGAVRRLVIAETDEKALQVADPAYRRWFYNMNYLWEKSGTEIGRFHRSLRAAIDNDVAFVGSPETVIEMINAYFRETGCNYLVFAPIFGDIDLVSASTTIELLREHVLPAVRETP